MIKIKIAGFIVMGTWLVGANLANSEPMTMEMEEAMAEEAVDVLEGDPGNPADETEDMIEDETLPLVADDASYACECYMRDTKHGVRVYKNSSCTERKVVSITSSNKSCYGSVGDERTFKNQSGYIDRGLFYSCEPWSGTAVGDSCWRKNN